MQADASIDVVLVPLDLPRERLADLERLLSPEERDRAARYRSPRDRDRFVAGRGSLRVILGGYLRADPAAVTITRGPQGKPLLGLVDERHAAHAAGGAQKLGFNLAHSAGLAVVAVSRGRNVGVDIEAVQPRADLGDIARNAFSPAELEALQGTPCLERTRAFYRCWTRKEAWVKALGTGFSTPPDSFDVSVSAREPARLLAVRGGGPGADGWELADIPAGPLFAAALAFDGGPAQIRLMERPRPSLRVGGAR